MIYLQNLTKTYDLPQAERFRNVFCQECGSQVPYISRDANYLVVPAGYLDEDPKIRPQANIFWQEKACWFDEGSQAPKFDQYPE